MGMSEWFGNSSWNPWIYTGMVFVLVLAGALGIRHWLWQRLETLVKSSQRTWDDKVLRAIHAPVTALIVIAAFGIAGQSAPPAVRQHPLMTHGVRVALIAVFFWILERGLRLLIQSQVLPENLSAQSRKMIQTVTRVFLFTIGLLIILDTVGVSITPLLASLGVGSIAIALALQDTLSNFFGGVYILADRPFRIGDYVEVENIKGHVEQIGWRSSRVRELNKNIVVVPNAKMASSIVRNFNMPFAERALSVECGVAYESDLEKVERVCIDVATEVQGRVSGGSSEFAPAVRFHTFADNSVNFTIALRVRDTTDTFYLKHEFIKALHRRFNDEGINIPFPQRVIHLSPEFALETGGPKREIRMPQPQGNPQFGPP